METGVYHEDYTQRPQISQNLQLLLDFNFLDHNLEKYFGGHFEFN